MKAALLIVLVAIGCEQAQPPIGGPEAAKAAKMNVTSPDFQPNQPISNSPTPPRLEWDGAPGGVKSFTIVTEDPDAPRATPFVHWMLANMPPTATHVEGGIAGKNDHGGEGYYPPHPPKGDKPHHYHFRVLALDMELPLKPGVSRDDLQKALSGHVLAEGEMVGTFQNP